MPTALPTRTIGSIRQMPRQPPAQLPKQPFVSRLEWPKRIIANREHFLARPKTLLADWEQLLAPHRAARLIAYHNTWPYFARRFRLNIVDVVESKEGVSPSPARLAALAATIREQKIRVIVHEPFEPEEASQLLARRTGAIVVKLAPSVGSLSAASGYVALFDYNVGILARALSTAAN
jgi:ABC-type Zn uptake system ZnuABC Zn-binding protein ZnuA